ncbi:Arm DNA-binding domain-containing protein [Sphingobium sp. AP49]|uniref:Arm DNA-binding domain-containing protein n=1 Tax=Sphingobium sp. AP49 TaxID=1144307 RepID=UPI001EE667B7|nr:Arm DNA-binding domain-containing protein [Sphingobium sp. AP49]WHO40927.1 Arm DNA-binding domain-containing protein [Sphingobium sp. AP49]
MPLTINDIKNAKPARSDYKLADSGGLYLLVSKAGGKTWRFKYRVGIVEKAITLGRYPELGLVAARDAHHEARKLLAEGKDPAIEKKRSSSPRLRPLKPHSGNWAMSGSWIKSPYGLCRTSNGFDIVSSAISIRYLATCLSGRSRVQPSCVPYAA